MDARFDVDTDSENEIIIHMTLNEVRRLISDLSELLYAAAVIKKGDKGTAFRLNGKLEIEEN